MVVRAAVAALFVWLAACDVGAVNGLAGPDGGGGGNGSATFVSMIQPLVNPKCTGCHSTTQPPNLSSFAALQQTYKTKPGANNILVTKGDATNGMHSGIVYFTATEKATVAAWIDSL